MQPVDREREEENMCGREREREVGRGGVEVGGEWYRLGKMVRRSGGWLVSGLKLCERIMIGGGTGPAGYIAAAVRGDVDRWRGGGQRGKEREGCQSSPN